MRRGLGIAAGVMVHGLFALMTWRLFLFLRDTTAHTPEGSLGIDALLALQFVVPHSWLLHPSTRKKLAGVIPDAFYGLLFTLVTTIGLTLIMVFWRHSPLAIWRLTGLGGGFMSAMFLVSWGFMLYSIGLTGFGWQTGYTPWLHWLRGLPPPKRTFDPRGVYRFLRHPVYLSFLGLVWFTPVMTLDRAILTAIWTAYIFYGSYLKDERLAHYMGERYRRYQAQVVGFPGMFWGPLAKRSPHSGLLLQPRGKSISERPCVSIAPNGPDC